MYTVCVSQRASPCRGKKDSTLCSQISWFLGHSFPKSFIDYENTDSSPASFSINNLQKIVWTKVYILQQKLFLKKIYIYIYVCVCVCVCVCSKWCVLAAQSCPSLCVPMDCNPPGYSVHGILQARILERVVIPFSRGSSQPRDQTWVSCIIGGFFTVWTTREAPRLLTALGCQLNIYIYLLLFIFGCATCRILVPGPGIEPMPPGVEVWSLNHWTSREAPGETTLYHRYVMWYQQPNPQNAFGAPSAYFI